MKCSYTEILNRLSLVFQKAGCRKTDAILIAESLLEAEACGITSHGIRMAKPHLQKIKDGNYNLSGELIVEKQSTTFTVVNSNNTVGMVSAHKCTRIAIKEAKLHGVHIVFSNHSNTFSAAFTYAKEIAENGLIGIVFCNSPAQMAPLGGREKLLGTNPFAFSVPAKKENYIVFDMATSVVAKSKINEALEKNIPIPEGWALTEKGEPTNDPAEAVKGLVLPMSGPKGYGLSLMIDIIAGLTSGAQYLDGVGRFYGSKDCMNVGHTFIAIDPLQIYGNDFLDAIDAYIYKIHNSKRINNNNIWMPGENKVYKFVKAQEEGIDIPDGFFESLS